MWILLWLALSAFVIGLFVWSLRILHRQKKTWRDFAVRHKLSYEPGKLMKSPKVNGMLGGYRVALYTDAQQTDDIRGERFVSVIVVNLGEGFPTPAIIGTPAFSGLMDQVVVTGTFTPDHPDWKPEYHIRTRDVGALKAWLTPERQKVLISLFTIRNCYVLVLFDENEALLHIETTDPLQNPEHLERLMRRVVGAAKKLVPQDDAKTGPETTADTDPEPRTEDT